MTERGDTTKAKLVAAARFVVSESGYARATTRAIAEAAGVSEGTIYRHFPDKRALFLAAVLDGNTDVMKRIDALASKAGNGSVEDNLLQALLTLAELRAEVMPLELAMLADPEMSINSGSHSASPEGLAAAGAVATYLSAEKALGRVRADVDCHAAEIALLTMLFGLALAPSPPGSPIDTALLASVVHMFVVGVAPPE